NVHYWVQRLGDEPPAVVALALHCLSAIRSEIDSDRYAAWSLAVDGPILAAMQRLDGEAQREAWACLINYGPMPPESPARIPTPPCTSHPPTGQRMNPKGPRPAASPFQPPSPCSAPCWPRMMPPSPPRPSMCWRPEPPSPPTRP